MCSGRAAAVGISRGDAIPRVMGTGIREEIATGRQGSAHRMPLSEREGKL